MHETPAKDARNSRERCTKQQQKMHEIVLEKNDFYEKIFTNKKFTWNKSVKNVLTTGGDCNDAEDGIVRSLNICELSVGPSRETRGVAHANC
jgi:hypothetical protein